MGIQKYLEKISWITRKWNIKFQLLNIYIHDHDGTWGFTFGTFVVDFYSYSFLSLEFRFPNKTNVNKFIVDDWDFVFTKNFLHKKMVDLEDRKTWARLSSLEKIQYKLLSKIFR